MSSSRVLLVAIAVVLAAFVSVLVWLDPAEEEGRAPLAAAAPERPPADDATRRVARSSGGARPRTPALPAPERAAAEQVPRREAHESPAPALRPVRGLLLDERTGEPVPHYELVLHELRWMQVGFGRAAPRVVRGSAPMRTDAEGRFATEAGFPVGCRIGGNWTPRPPEPADTPVFAGAELRLHTRVGPTYHLALELPPAALHRELRAALREGDPRLPGSSGLASARVADDGGPWVRFAWSRVVAEQEGESRWLEVATSDGLFAGAAEVVLRAGIYPGAVRVDLRPRGALRGRVLDARGEPVEGAELRLDDGPPGGDAPILMRTRADGEYSFEPQSAGAWTLSARAPSFEPWERMVVLAEGAETELDVQLLELSPGGRVSGLLRTATGEHHPDALVFLDALQPPFGTFELPVEWERGEGGWIGRFAVDDLPAGEYAPQLLTDDHFDWEGPIDPLRPPRTKLVYTCDDDVSVADLLIEVVDAESGRSVGDFEGWWIAPMDGEDFRGESGRPAPLVQGYPLGRPLRWFVWADGYGVAAGTAGAFEATAVDGAPARLATARLPRGWGAVISAWDGEDHPLAGVRVVLDGRSAGVTDAEGLLVLSATAAPSSFSFEHEQQVWVDGTVAPGARSLPRGGRRIELVFATK